MTAAKAFEIALEEGILKKGEAYGYIEPDLKVVKSERSARILVLAMHFMYTQASFRCIPDRSGLPLFVEQEGD